MSTPTEEILARYRQVQNATDTFGRVIVVGRLRPSQQVAIMKMADSDSAGVIALMVAAGSVRKIDGDDFSFPRSVGELNAVMDRLDAEGLTAASAAFQKLNGHASAIDGAAVVA